MHRFSAEILKIGINPVVDPPDDVLAAVFEKAGKSRGPIPVCGTINGADFIQTLVRFRAKWRLYVNGPMLAASGLAVGDLAQVEIDFDPRPREVPMPPVFRSALEADKTARLAFASLAPSRQKEILKYLGSLKTAASIERNVEKVVKQLGGHAVDKPHVAMRSVRKP